MVAILHPYILHYREDFFRGISKVLSIKIFCYESKLEIQKANFKEANLPVTQIKSIKLGPFLWYNPRELLSKDNSVLILMLNFSHLTTWLLLLTKPIHNKKIILWGHGISVKRFTSEEKRPNFLLKWMIKLADTVWFYTKYELKIWKDELPSLNAISLDNTISEVDKILNSNQRNKYSLRQEFLILQPKIFIFCARFNEPGRRPELLLEAIRILDPNEFGFIIIGDGKLKPDFKPFKNVYDFGAIYDSELKSKLFQAADIYFQPGWIGLSIVEAMAYGKPIFTLERSTQLMQCVEYSYIRHNYNGMIFKDINSLVNTVTDLADADIQRLSENAKEFTKSELSMSNMVQNATNSITT